MKGFLEPLLGRFFSLVRVKFLLCIFVFIYSMLCYLIKSEGNMYFMTKWKSSSEHVSLSFRRNLFNSKRKLRRRVILLSLPDYYATYSLCIYCTNTMDDIYYTHIQTQRATLCLPGSHFVNIEKHKSEERGI